MHRLVAALTVLAVGVATTGQAHAAPDADGVRGVLDSMNNSYNRSDFTKFASHLCADLLQTADFAAEWYASRTSDGPTAITVNSVRVIGGSEIARAIANVRFEAADHVRTLDVEFLREGSEWKACRYRAGQTV